MFHSAVFSPFLGLRANSQTLNFHATLSSPRVRGGWVPSSLRVSVGSWLGPAGVVGAQVRGGSLPSP